MARDGLRRSPRMSGKLTSRLMALPMSLVYLVDVLLDSQVGLLPFIITGFLSLRAVISIRICGTKSTF